jgi:sugar-phosphatase
LKFFASGLLFDNDGVLVDSHAAASAAWKQWCSEYAPHIDWDRPENAGQRAEDKVREWIASADLFEVANDRINQLEQDTAHETVALAGAVQLLTSLPANTWTVCTSANPNLGRARLLAAGLPVPPQLVTAADVQRGKPHPDPYLLGAERLGFDPENCVVFEDAAAGALAAAAAGVGLIVGVSEKALDTEADIVVRDLTGITFDGEELVIPDRIRLR